MDEKKANTEISRITQKITQLQDEMNKQAVEYSSKFGKLIIENERHLRSRKKQKLMKKWLYLFLSALGVFLIGVIMQIEGLAYVVLLVGGFVIIVRNNDDKYAVGYQIRQSLFVKNHDVTDKDANNRFKWDNQTMLTGMWVCEKCGQINNNYNNDGIVSLTCIACKTKRV